MIPKFRAWHKTWEEMGWIACIRYKKSGEIAHLSFRRNIYDGNIYGGLVNLDEIELMQSTGLFDEFDKELFEGDVILWTYWDEFEDSGRAKIIFDKGMFKLLDTRTGKDVWDNLFNCLENCEVYFQGNIYENPELLEV